MIHNQLAALVSAAGWLYTSQRKMQSSRQHLSVMCYALVGWDKRTAAKTENPERNDINREEKKTDEKKARDSEEVQR